MYIEIRVKEMQQKKRIYCTWWCLLKDVWYWHFWFLAIRRWILIRGRSCSCINNIIVIKSVRVCYLIRHTVLSTCIFAQWQNNRCTFIGINLRVFNKGDTGVGGPGSLFNGLVGGTPNWRLLATGDWSGLEPTGSVVSVLPSIMI